MAFNGTNGLEHEDVMTDAQLAGSGVPDLHVKALQVYDEVNREHPISAVCGNSLGGSLSNFVSVNRGVRSVTINPAVLPNDPETLSKDSSKITNYIGYGDPLNRVQKSVDIKNPQMKGKCIDIDYGVTTLKSLMASHVGYSVDENKISKIEMGEGKIDIIVDASKNIALNPFTGQTLAETPDNFEVVINSETMEVIKNEVFK